MQFWHVFYLANVMNASMKTKRASATELFPGTELSTDEAELLERICAEVELPDSVAMMKGVTGAKVLRWAQRIQALAATGEVSELFARRAIRDLLRQL